MNILFFSDFRAVKILVVAAKLFYLLLVSVTNEVFKVYRGGQSQLSASSTLS